MFPGSRLIGPLARSEDQGFRVGATSILAVEMGGGRHGARLVTWWCPPVLDCTAQIYYHSLSLYNACSIPH